MKKKVGIEEFIESLVQKMTNTEVLKDNGDVTFIGNIKINNDQRIITVACEDGSIFDIKVSAKTV